jgi:hypothetical protein
MKSTLSALLVLPLIALGTAVWAQEARPEAKTEPQPAVPMLRFVIEREIPGASKMTPEELRDAASKSNRVLRELGPDIQWVHSYIAGDKVYCVYNASSEAMIRLHAERGGFPANKITLVSAVIDPTTANPTR